MPGLMKRKIAISA